MWRRFDPLVPYGVASSIDRVIGPAAIAALYAALESVSYAPANDAPQALRRNQRQAADIAIFVLIFTTQSVQQHDCSYMPHSHTSSYQPRSGTLSTTTSVEAFVYDSSMSTPKWELYMAALRDPLWVISKEIALWTVRKTNSNLSQSKIDRSTKLCG